MSKRHSITPEAYLYLEQDNNILLLRRANTNYEDGKYSLVAGHVEPMESFQDAAIREAKEEAGIGISDKDLTLVHIMQRSPESSGDTERVGMFFHVKKWSGELKNMEPHKCDDLSWFPIDNLPDNIIPYIKTALDHIHKQVLLSYYDNK